jgi:hypothetical protein
MNALSAPKNVIVAHAVSVDGVGIRQKVRVLKEAASAVLPLWMKAGAQCKRFQNWDLVAGAQEQLYKGKAVQDTNQVVRAPRQAAAVAPTIRRCGTRSQLPHILFQAQLKQGVRLNVRQQQHLHKIVVCCSGQGVEGREAQAHAQVGRMAKAQQKGVAFIEKQGLTSGQARRHHIQVTGTWKSKVSVQRRVDGGQRSVCVHVFDIGQVHRKAKHLQKLGHAAQAIRVHAGWNVHCFFLVLACVYCVKKSLKGNVKLAFYAALKKHVNFKQQFRGQRLL